MLRSLSLILTLALLVGAFTACSPEPTSDIGSRPSDDVDETVQGSAYSGPVYADEIFSLNCDISAGLNPYKTTASSNMEIAPLMYEGLFSVNSDFSFDNDLCESYFTADGKVYQFEVRKGVKLHDGSDLTPEDVAYSIEQARVSDNYSSRLTVINAAYVLDGTVFVELNRPNFNLPLLLDLPVVKAGSGAEAVPVGTGPYSFVDAGEYCYLKAFGSHEDFGSLPTERIYLKEYSGGDLITAFDSGLVDLVSTSKADVNYLEYSGNTESRIKDTTVLYFLGVSSRNKFLADKGRRTLLSSMIDREMLAEEIINAWPVTIPLHPKAYFYSDDYDSFTIREQDIEAAKIEYMVEDYDADGMLEYMDIEESSVEEINLKLVVNKENPTKLEAAHAISERLGACGIDVSVTELTWSSYLRALRNGEYDLYYGEVMLTADFDLTQLLSYGGNANYGVYSPEVQSLIYDFNSSGEENKQDAAAALFGCIAENLPIISLMFEIETIHTHRETVSGISPAIHNIFNDITEWLINVE